MAKKSDENKSNNVLSEALKGCYGSQVSPSVVKQWLIDNIMDNTNRDVRITLSIMGAPGTSKTELVKSLATTPIEYNGVKYDGFQIVDIPLAQIDEQGDVLGFPEVFIEMEREVPDEK